MLVRLTKTGSIFGHLAKGTTLDVRVPKHIRGEREARIRARRMFKRDHPNENEMEWEAELVPEEPDA